MARLDKIDIKILAALQNQGRMTNLALSESVHLSPSSCLERTKRLEKEGFIKGFRAEIAVEKLGHTLTVFTEFTLKDHSSKSFRRFEDGIKHFSEITECHLISGGFDYLLKFICRDMLAYQETIEAMLDSNLGIEKYFSYVVIKSPMERSLEIDHEILN